MQGGGEMGSGSLMSLFAALSYGVASMAMVFINKAVLMQYSHSMTLLTFQQLATNLLIHIGRVRGYTKAKDLDWGMAKKLLPLSIFYNANVAFALASLKGVNIPMYIALKRLTPLAVLVAGFFSGKRKPPLQVCLSVILTALGVIIAAIGDFSFDLFGYTMALTSVFFQISNGYGPRVSIKICDLRKVDSHGKRNLMHFQPIKLTILPVMRGCLYPSKAQGVSMMLKYLVSSSFFQTMYLVLVEKSGAEDGLSSIELMFYNAILSIPFLLFLIIATGEFPQSVYIIFQKADSLSFFVILMLSLVMGIVLNFTMFLCTLVNSALTTTIVGVLKGVGSTTLGFVLLGGVQVHALNVTGLVINTAGGIWYSYAKYQQKKKRRNISDEEALISKK